MRFFLGLALVLGLSACAYHGSGFSTVDDPFVRNLAWFSYLDGHDIRETCGAGSIDRFRLVYNGQYERQVRSYEVTGDGAGGGILVSRARAGSPNLLDWNLQDPTAPWRWEKAESRLSPLEMAEFVEKLQASGFGQPAPQGKILHSHDFYWVASGCRAGTFSFQAWVDARGDFTRIQFKDFLVSRDRTGLAFREAKPVPLKEKLVTGRRKGENPPDFFVLTVDNDGIGGLINAF